MLLNYHNDHYLLPIDHIFELNKAIRQTEIKSSKFYYQSQAKGEFRNDEEKFTDVTEAAGIKGGMANYGLGVAISDFNNDGWPDVYVYQ